MNQREHLLSCLIEECSEVIKECTKILRFGFVDENDEIRHTTLKGRIVDPNGPRLEQEIIDVFAIVDMLFEEEEIFPIMEERNYEEFFKRIEAKQDKVWAYMDKAEEYGTLKQE